MYIIVGLGNPETEKKGIFGRKSSETKYAHTRHNVGFDVLSKYAERHGMVVWEKLKKGLVSEGKACGEKILLVKPQTFMNNSGECVRAIMDFFKIKDMRKVIVVCDDINLDPGMIRIRVQGSAGGHNGLKDIFEKCGTQAFLRVRIGVGCVPPGGDQVSWVLGHMSGEDRAKCDEAIENACDALDIIIKDGANAAMNKYNARKKLQSTISS